MKVILNRELATAHGAGAPDGAEPIGIIEQCNADGTTTAIFRIRPYGKYIAVVDGAFTFIDGRKVNALAGLSNRKPKIPKSLTTRIAGNLTKVQVEKCLEISRGISVIEGIRRAIDEYEVIGQAGETS